MKELLRLKSFQQILFWFVILGIIIGALATLYFINPNKFQFILLLPSLPALFFIGKGLYKNIPLLIKDLRSIYVNQ